MKLLAVRGLIAGSTIFVAFNGVAQAEAKEARNEQAWSVGYACRAAVRAELKGPDCRMPPPLIRRATATFHPTPRLR
jgi:hypothetical protein